MSNFFLDSRTALIFGQIRFYFFCMNFYAAPKISEKVRTPPETIFDVEFGDLSNGAKMKLLLPLENSLHPKETTDLNSGCLWVGKNQKSNIETFYSTQRHTIFREYALNDF